jgi:hypothetical protein
LQSITSPIPHNHNNLAPFIADAANRCLGQVGKHLIPDDTATADVPWWATNPDPEAKPFIDILMSEECTALRNWINNRIKIFVKSSTAAVIEDLCNEVALKEFAVYISSTLETGEANMGDEEKCQIARDELKALAFGRPNGIAAANDPAQCAGEVEAELNEAKAAYGVMISSMRTVPESRPMRFIHIN